MHALSIARTVAGMLQEAGEGTGEGEGEAEIRHRANPGSLDFLPVSESVEDHATMPLFVIEKLGEMVE